MEHKAEAARLGHAKDLEALGDPPRHLGDERVVGELARGLRVGVILLRHGHEELEMDVQPELEHRLDGIDYGARHAKHKTSRLSCPIYRDRSRHFPGAEPSLEVRVALRAVRFQFLAVKCTGRGSASTGPVPIGLTPRSMSRIMRQL